MSETSDSDILMNGEEWFAKNWRLLLNSALMILVGVAGYNWWINSGAESASAAEKELHSAISSNTTNLLEMALELKGVHVKHPENKVGERALILSANIALQEGEYETAKKRFESYLSEYETDGNWLTEAKIGQAICKEAEGDVKSAINVYQSLTNSISSSISGRSIALLESAKVDLDPLPSRPEPVKEEPEKPNTSKGIELEKNTPSPLDPEDLDNK